MMDARLEIHSLSSQRTLARALAAILLVAQLLAAAHYHSRQSSSRYSAPVAISLDDGLCTLCLFHHYSSAASAAVALPFKPAVIERIALYTAQSWPLYSFNSYLSGRSPPVSA
jgi:hypothetical protein